MKSFNTRLRSLDADTESDMNINVMYKIPSTRNDVEREGEITPLF